MHAHTYTALFASPDHAAGLRPDARHRGMHYPVRGNANKAGSNLIFAGNVMPNPFGQGTAPRHRPGPFLTVRF